MPPPSSLGLNGKTQPQDWLPVLPYRQRGGASRCSERFTFKCAGPLLADSLVEMLCLHMPLALKGQLLPGSACCEVATGLWAEGMGAAREDAQCESSPQGHKHLELVPKVSTVAGLGGNHVARTGLGESGDRIEDRN